MTIAYAILQMGEQYPKFLVIPIDANPEGDLGNHVTRNLQVTVHDIENSKQKALENQGEGADSIGHTKIKSDYSWKILAIVPDLSALDDLGHIIDESAHHLSVELATLNRNIGDLISVTARTK